MNAQKRRVKRVGRATKKGVLLSKYFQVIGVLKMNSVWGNKKRTLYDLGPFLVTFEKYLVLGSTAHAHIRMSYVFITEDRLSCHIYKFIWR